MTVRLGPAVNLGEALGGPERNYAELYGKTLAYKDTQAGIDARVEVPALAAGLAKLQGTRTVPPVNVFYVNAAEGNDGNDGFSAATAKQTLTAMMAAISETFDLRGRQVYINLAAGSYTMGSADFLQTSCNSSTWNISGVGPASVIGNHIGVLNSRLGLYNLAMHSAETWVSYFTTTDVTFLGQNGMPFAAIINCGSVGIFTNSTISGNYDGTFVLCKVSSQAQIANGVTLVGTPNIGYFVLAELGAYALMYESIVFSGSFTGHRAWIDGGSRLDCRLGNPDLAIPGTLPVFLGEPCMESGQVGRFPVTPVTSERWTGETNGGKRVYCRVVEAGAGPNAGTKTIPHGIVNLQEILSFQVRWLRGDGEVLMTSGSGVEARMDRGNLIASAVGDMSAYNLRATVYYLCSDR